jgi:two-component system chemotaxis response regulator CheY
MQSPPKIRLERLRILTVDNFLLMRDLVHGVMKSVGVGRLQHALDGCEALGMLRSFGPHLAIVDWEMEPMTGLEFVRAVRALPERDNPYLPIIMLTSHGEESWVLAARQAGIHEYLTKPFTPAALLNRLMAILTDPRPFIRSETYFGPAPRNIGGV